MEKIKNQKSKIRNILCLMSCVLFLLLIYVLITSAQDIIVKVKKSGEAEEGGSPSVEIINEADIIVETAEPETPEGAGKAEGNAGRNMRERRARERGASPGGQAEGRQGEAFPPEVLKIMRDENISPQDLQDPEVRKKLRERVESARTENEKSSGQDRAPGEGKGPVGGPVSEGLQRYVDSIVNKNLFLPLGTSREERKAQFALTAVMSGSAGGFNKAIIEETGGGKSYYVSEGDNFAGGVEVVDIEDRGVELNRSGEKITLKLGEGTQGNQGGGRGAPRPRGGRNPGGGGESRTDGGGKPEGNFQQGGSDDFDPSQIPPFAMEILKSRGITIDDLKRDPDLRNKLREEFEGRAKELMRNEGQPSQPTRQGFRREGSRR